MTTSVSTENSALRMPAARAVTYRAYVLRAIPRLLGMLDRDPESPTAGSFDRDHWAWKFRDYPVNMLQTGLVPLALLHTTPAKDNPYFAAVRVRGWILAAIDATLQRQHRNGAFDSVAPYSQDHGATLALVYALATSLHSLGDSVPSPLRDRIAMAVRRGCAFAERSDEDYAFISNHQALFAMAWRRAGVLLGDARLHERGAATIDAIIARQSRDGWYTEYGGPDPGYESLGISYLAMYLVETGHPQLAQSLDRAVQFFAHCVQPDGSVGGAVGSRLTQLWYPAGVELLANSNPLAARICEFLRVRLGRANVVTPDTVDSHNLPSLLYSYLVAAESAEAAPRESDSQKTPSLPCETIALWQHFDASGLTVASTPHYYAVCNARRGGVISVCDRSSEQLVYEDTGVAIATPRRTWASAAPSEVVEVRADANKQVVSTKVRCGWVRNEPVTPGKFLILRVLCLTAFRSLALGRVLRRMIIARLVTGRARGPFICERVVRFTDDSITLDDRVVSTAGGQTEATRITRGFQPFHMGSARYFHSRDLTDIPVVDWSSDVHGESAPPAGRSMGASGQSVFARRVLNWTGAGVSTARAEGANSARGDGL